MLTILAQTDEGTTGGSFLLTLLLYAVIIGGLFYFLLIRPQRTRARRHEALLSDLEEGDEVHTIGGIFGTIEHFDDDTVVLLTEGGGRLRVLRRALAGKAGAGSDDVR